MSDPISFPFEPYPQQRDLMRSLYECIEKSSVGCFESPTGTGKSLSVICATLSWQYKEEKRILDEQFAASLKAKTKTDDDWLMAFQSSFQNDTPESKKKKRAYDLHLLMKDRVRRASATNPSIQTRDDQFRKRTVKAADSTNLNSENVQEPEDEFSLKHYDSSDEISQQKAKKNSKLFTSLADCSDSEDDEDVSTSLGLPKIYYCSRTHSQISQFVSEIKRTAFANARCITLGSRRNMCINSDVTKLQSDSKISEMCLEMQKSKSKGSTSIDDDHLDTKKQRKLKISTKPCQYHKKIKEQEFANNALGKIRDIESLVSLGDELGACPYYATRRAINDAQIVCMPYNMLLHDDLRSSMGINLANSIVIFDEAHNVVEAVNHIYSADVSYEDLGLAAQCVEDYLIRFRSVLTGKNYYYINILLSVINGFKQCLKPDLKKEVLRTAASDLATEPVIKCGGTGSGVIPSPAVRVHDPSKLAVTTEILGSNDFLFRCGLDNVNLFKVKRHITETNLDSKVGGFGDHQEKKRLEVAKELLASTVIMKGKNQKVKYDSHVVNKAFPSFPTSTSTSNSSCCNTGSPEVLNIDVDTKNSTGSYKQALRNILTLITCLTNVDTDGRVAVSKHTTQPSVGITTSISPNADFPSSSSIKFILLNPSIHFQKIVDQSRSVLLLGGTLQPFAYVKSFLFPNVQPDKISLFACGHVVNATNVLALIASRGPLGGKFEFTHESRMQPTRLSELNSSLQLISKSVPHGMVIFFSSYQYMSNVLSKWRSTGQYDDLSASRSVFVEPRLAGDAEKVWTLYSEKAVADGGKGAMLFCVMGGKLSEGINFSDRLARCVVVIGMPYPDGRDPILQEKLKFATLVEKDDKAGKRLYEAMCMRIVNQCIGRSIRHINDYSAIVLLDCRYSQPRVTTQLPMWLSSEVQNCSDFMDIEMKLKTFFSARTV